MNTFKWTVYWSSGPYDNPNDGEFEVEADTIDEALAEVNEKLNVWEGYFTPAIDGITRSDIL